jgi:hypothetical protein
MGIGTSSEIRGPVKFVESLPFWLRWLWVVRVAVEGAYAANGRRSESMLGAAAVCLPLPLLSEDLEFALFASLPFALS